MKTTESDFTADSPEKRSSSPKKNFRYSNVGFDDDDNIEQDLMIQKALSLPLNMDRKEQKRERVSSPLDNYLLDEKIEEWEEDIKSVDSDASDSFIQLQKQATKRGNEKHLSEKKQMPAHAKKFFIHKGVSFKKTVSRSKSPTKGVLENIKNSTRKIKFMKLNSLAFKADAKQSARGSAIGDRSESSNDDEFKFGSNKSINKTLISPILWDQLNNEGKVVTAKISYWWKLTFTLFLKKFLFKNYTEIIDYC